MYKKSLLFLAAPAAAWFACASTVHADVVHSINTLIEGHLCASDSLNCVNPESYPAGLFINADIKIKDDYPAIFFDDTTSGERDWEIQVDYGQNGVPSQAFSIGHNAQGSTTGDAYPFVIENGTADNLLFLDAAERIGINTAAPGYTVDAVGNRIRLRNTTQSIQMRVDGTDTDIEAIGGQLFLRSSTVGENIIMNPFGPDGDVGIGTTAPAAKLHVANPGSTIGTIPQIMADTSAASQLARDMIVLQNNGVSIFSVRDLSPTGSTWNFQTEGPSFRFNKAGTGGAEVVLRRRGDFFGPTMSVDGSIQASNVFYTSSRSKKTGFQPVDGKDVLARVMKLPITQWSFKEGPAGQMHIGPVAEDFQQLFDLNKGTEEANISMIDVNGVALAAIQGMYGLLTERDQEIENLKKENLALNEKLGQLDAMNERLSLLEKHLRQQ